MSSNTRDVDPSGVKSEDKIPAKRKLIKKRPKDHPKRPLSAYNFFLKEERAAIVKFVKESDKILEETTGAKSFHSKKEDNVDEPKDDIEYKVHLDDNTVRRIKKENGMICFEEMGKLIGQRWKQVDPTRLSKLTEMARKDSERYKKEMAEYKKRHDTKVRTERHEDVISATGSKSLDAHTGYENSARVSYQYSSQTGYQYAPPPTGYQHAYAPHTEYQQHAHPPHAGYQDAHTSTHDTSTFSSAMPPPPFYPYGNVRFTGQQHMYPSQQSTLYGTVSSRGVSGDAFMNAGQQQPFYGNVPSNSMQSNDIRSNADPYASYR